MTDFSDLSPVGVWRTDPSGQIIETNAMWHRITGIADDGQPVGDRLREAIHEQDRGRVAAEWADIVTLKQPARFDCRTVHPGGRIAWVRIEAAPDRTSSGQLRGFVGTTTDIDDLKRTQEKLAASEERLRIALDASRLGLWEWDLAAGTGWWSARAREIMGIAEDRLMTPEEHAALIHPDDRARTAAAGEALIRKGESFVIQYRVRPHDGGERWVESRGAARRGANGRTKRATGTIADITEERAAAERLRMSEERVRLAQAAGGVGIFDWNMATDETFWSPETFRLYGRTSNAPPSYSDWQKLIHPDDLQRVEALIADAVAGRPHYAVEYRIIRESDRAERWVSVRAEILRDAAGNPTRIVGGLTDVTDQRQTESALAARVGELAAISDLAPAAIWVAHDPECRTVTGNRFAEEMLAIRPSGNHSLTAADGDRPMHFVCKRDGVEIEVESLPLQRAARGDAVAEESWDVVFDDGRTISLIGTAATLRSADGAPRGAIMVALDVTQRRATEMLLADVLESTTDQVATVDRDWTYVYQNRRSQRQLGNLVGRNLWEAYPHLIGTDLETTFRKAMRERVPLSIENQNPETGRWTETHCFPSGERLTFFFNDVTEVKAAQAALAERERLLRAIGESTPDLIFAKDRDSRLLYANPACLALIGKPWDVVAGQNENSWHDDPVEAASILANDRAVMDSGVAQIVDEVFTTPGGATRVMQSTKAPMRDAEGRVVGLVGVTTDVTERKAAETALRDLNASLSERVAAAIAEREAAIAQLHEVQKLETLGQLTGGVAHDFNNLLTPIVGTLDILKRRYGDNPRDARLIDSSLAAAERARTLVQRLLAFGRRQLLQPRPVDVVSLVGGMIDMIRRSIGPQIAIATDLPDAVPAARVDPGQLELALLNFAVNARDAMPEGGLLRISVGAEQVEGEHPAGLMPGGYVRIDVADTGSGMDEDTLRRAVEPFFTTKGVGKGTGLGLSMAHGLAAQLGGALNLASRPGEGTQVRMWLPIADGENVELPRPELVAAREIETATTLLLVDDEELVRLGTADMLSDLGYSVIEASSGGEALTILESGTHIDALVTDYLMPGMTGGELIAAARVRRPALPALVVTGYVDPDGLGIDAPVLAKPFRREELGSRLEQLLDPAKVVAFPGRVRPGAA